MKVGNIMTDILRQYLFPFIMLALIFAYIALRFRSNRELGCIVITFLLITFAPNLLYALIADNSSGLLFLLSIVAAIIVAGIMFFQIYRKR